MNDEFPGHPIKGTVQTPKQPRLPKGCGFLLAVAGVLIFLVVGAYYYQFQIVEGVRKRVEPAAAVAISNAVQQFRADYDRLPLPSGPLPAGGDRDTDTSPAHGFVAVLLGKEWRMGDHQNMRNTNYVEGTKPAKPKPGGDYPWKDGLIFDATTGAYGVVDYQGKPYRLRLDTNSDKQLANPNPDEVVKGRPTLSKQVIVWGAGKDGKWETWDDNPKSWD